jgi:hypothetical protein
MENETRKCSGCGETKPLTEFKRDSTKPGGYGYRCKPCTAASRKEQRAKQKGANTRTGEHPNVSAGERMDASAGGRENARADEQANARTNEYANTRTEERKYMRTRERADVRTPERTNAGKADVHLVLPADLTRRLKVEAAMTGQDMSAIIAQLLEKHLPGK